MSKVIGRDTKRIESAIKAILNTTDKRRLVDLWNDHLDYNNPKDLCKVIYSWDVFNEAMDSRGYSCLDMIYMAPRAKGNATSEYFMIAEHDQLIFFDRDDVPKYVDVGELAETMIDTWNGYGDSLIQSILDFVPRGAY